MTLMFDVVIDKNQYNVGTGSVPVRVQNIRSSSGSYGAARFYLSSSGKGTFSDYIYTAPDGRIYMSWGGTIGTSGSWNTKQCVYTPSDSGTHVITVVGVPYGPDNLPRTGEGSTVSANISISAMYCDYARAMFTTNVVDGFVPLTVNFNCTTPNQNVSIMWDFGDGTTSTQRSPTHTYQKSGQYRPKLTVSGWSNPSCTGSPTSSVVSNRIISVFAAGAPQCVTGIRCNSGAGFYEECVNGRYALTTTRCGATLASATAAQAAYNQIVANAQVSAAAVGSQPLTAVQLNRTAIVAAAAAAGSAAPTTPVPMYQPSVTSTTAGGGTVGTDSAGIFSRTSILFNPVTLAAAGLTAAGIAIYFWKRKSRGEL